MQQQSPSLNFLNPIHVLSFSQSPIFSLTFTHCSRLKTSGIPTLLRVKWFLKNTLIYKRIRCLLTKELRERHSGWSISSSSRIAEKTDLFSALSIIVGLVPKIVAPWLYSGRARLFGIWPPTEIITPLHTLKPKNNH